MTVHELLIEDHTQLRQHVADLRKVLVQNPSQLESLFLNFQTRVVAHFKKEDAIYYPSVDIGKMFADRELLHTLRNDHAAVVFSLESLAIRLRKKVPMTEWTPRFEKMTDVLLKHFDTEEQVLFPHVESSLAQRRVGNALERHSGTRMKLPLAQRMARMQRSTIREILKITTRKDVISFAGGLPAPDLFPLKEFTLAMQDALKEGAPSLQYDITEGYLPLKKLLCQWLSKRGIRCQPDNMLLTNGSQQALDLLGKILINPGDSILVEDPTYLGAIQAFNAYQARYLTVPMDDQGLSIQHVEKTLRQHRAACAYLVPTFQNPSGITMSLERRLAFLSLAQQKKLWIIEDDPYGFLRFSGTATPTLFELARGRGVIYLSTFSKILSPGIRLGFVVAEKPVIQSLVLAKQAADLQPNTLIQRAVYHYCRRGFLDRHIPLIIDAYREKASCMLAAMNRYFPTTVEWVQPEGGMFIWCRLKGRLSSMRLFKQAIRQKVAFVTGTVFHANGGGDDTLRLNFTNSSPAQIQEGIRRLGRVFSNR